MQELALPNLTPDDAESLAALQLPVLSKLELSRVRHARYYKDSVLRLLVSAPWLKRLHSLAITGCVLLPDGLAPLAAVGLPLLEELVVKDSANGNKGSLFDTGGNDGAAAAPAAALAAAPAPALAPALPSAAGPAPLHLPLLRRLVLIENRCVSGADVLRLLSAQLAPTTEEGEGSGNGPDAVADCDASPLEELVLMNNKRGGTDMPQAEVLALMRAMAAAPLRKLRGLSISGGVGDRVIGELASAPWAGGLERLALAWNDELGASGDLMPWAALTGAPLRALRALDLSYSSGMSAGAGALLGTAEWLGRLESLNLKGTAPKALAALQAEHEFDALKSGGACEILTG
ncbi:hypothetical protein MNEG_3300 [Monoraphidium neglectum]|jgi:hypothetical protein|uniref:Uncharacterized protein n=1 Tax=Monoraphidium neglectum TaxID=145388 RepID=A0A0D2NID3_9CHLO|nr:hypothetical protein MNEG_3300 [Monoraphidium neglectum]KIZ04656.1 hypothetical protein MNEG_3300 [Monoraphidium neglectum]|eukprot:XP_013903675.1 hypothetical protein MNEG_3300 [Monoraphidium neglectum]